MKFLIDECLHTSLISLAHDAGHVCEHVNFLGLGERDLTNAVLEVDLVASSITCREYVYPGPEQ
jgi:hypothetical protein